MTINYTYRWLSLIALGLTCAFPAIALELLDQQRDFWIDESDVSQLVFTPSPCKRPSAFSVVSVPSTQSYKGLVLSKSRRLLEIQVDPRNWYQFIDLDADGICEVEAETCNFSNAMDGSKNDSCAEGWFQAFKYRDGNWFGALELHGGSSGERFRGSTTFKYFNKSSDKLIFTIFHNFSSDTAGPDFVITYFTHSKPPSPGQGWPQSQYDSYDERGPLQRRGAYIPLLELHINRLLKEYRWRVDHCGGTDGYHDTDSRSASLGQLADTIGMFMVSNDVLSQPRDTDPKRVNTVKRWNIQIRNTLGIANPGDGINTSALQKRCAPNGGYRDIKVDNR